MAKKLSTPFDPILSQDSDIENLLDSMGDSRVGPVEQGEIVIAHFLSASQSEAFFDIGDKKEAVCDISEFSKAPNLGQEYFALVLDTHSEGLTRISVKEAIRHQAWSELQDACEMNLALAGRILRSLEAGYLIEYYSLELFMPFSQTGIASKQHSAGKTYPKNSAKSRSFKEGDSINFYTLELKPKRMSAIVSHRKVLEERNEALWKAFLADPSHKVGETVECTVSHVASFGLLVELCGLQGVLNRQDVSWGKREAYTKLQNDFSKGQKLKLKLLSIDHASNHIQLGLKQLEQEPWDWVIQQGLRKRQIVEATVLHIAPYGAFLQLHPGVEGLLHVNEMSWEYRKKEPKNYVKEGELIKVEISDIKAKLRQISFSLKNTLPDPWDLMKNRFSESQVCEGKVLAITKSGSFVSICEGVDGYIHQKEYNWDASYTPPFKKGDTISFKILKFDNENKRVFCGSKQTLDSPYTILKKENPRGTVMKVTVKKILDFALIVKISKNIEGNIFRADLPVGPEKKLEECYKVGDILQAEVKEVLAEKRRVYLSVTKFQRKQEKEAMKEYLQKEESPSTYNPFADLLKK